MTPPPPMAMSIPPLSIPMMEFTRKAMATEITAGKRATDMSASSRRNKELIAAGPAIA